MGWGLDSSGEDEGAQAPLGPTSAHRAYQDGGRGIPPRPDPRGPARATGLLPVHQEPEETLLPRAGNGAAEQILPAPPLNYLMSYRSRWPLLSRLSGEQQPLMQ